MEGAVISPTGDIIPPVTAKVARNTVTGQLKIKYAKYVILLRNLTCVPSQAECLKDQFLALCYLSCILMTCLMY